MIFKYTKKLGDFCKFGALTLGATLGIMALTTVTHAEDLTANTSVDISALPAGGIDSGEAIDLKGFDLTITLGDPTKTIGAITDTAGSSADNGVINISLTTGVLAKIASVDLGAAGKLVVTGEAGTSTDGDSTIAVITGDADLTSSAQSTITGGAANASNAGGAVELEIGKNLIIGGTNNALLIKGGAANAAGGTGGAAVLDVNGNITFDNSSRVINVMAAAKAGNNLGGSATLQVAGNIGTSDKTGTITLDDADGVVSKLTLDGSAGQSVSSAITAAATNEGQIEVTNANGVTFGGAIGVNGTEIGLLSLQAGKTTFKATVNAKDISLNSSATAEFIGAASVIDGAINSANAANGSLRVTGANATVGASGANGANTNVTIAGIYVSALTINAGNANGDSAARTGGTATLTTGSNKNVIVDGITQINASSGLLKNAIEVAGSNASFTVGGSFSGQSIVAVSGAGAQGNDATGGAGGSVTINLDGAVTLSSVSTLTALNGGKGSDTTDSIVGGAGGNVNLIASGDAIDFGNGVLINDGSAGAKGTGADSDSLDTNDGAGGAGGSVTVTFDGADAGNDGITIKGAITAAGDKEGTLVFDAANFDNAADKFIVESAIGSATKHLKQLNLKGDNTLDTNSYFKNHVYVQNTTIDADTLNQATTLHFGAKGTVGLTFSSNVVLNSESASEQANFNIAGGNAASYNNLVGSMNGAATGEGALTVVGGAFADLTGLSIGTTNRINSVTIGDTNSGANVRVKSTVAEASIVESANTLTVNNNSVVQLSEVTKGSTIFKLNQGATIGTSNANGSNITVKFEAGSFSDGTFNFIDAGNSSNISVGGTNLTTANAGETLTKNIKIINTALTSYVVGYNDTDKKLTFTATSKNNNEIASAIGVNTQQAADLKNMVSVFSVQDTTEAKAFNGFVSDLLNNAGDTSGTASEILVKKLLLKSFVEQSAVQTETLTAGVETASSAGVAIASVSSNRLAALRHGDVTGFNAGNRYIGHNMLWGKVFASQSTQNSVKNVAGYDADSTGLAIGYDFRPNHNQKANLGIAFTYSGADVTGKGAGRSTQDINSANIAFYGDAQTFGGGFVEAQLSFGTSSVSTKRNVTVGVNQTDSVRGEYSVSNIGGRIGYGYDIKSNNHVVTPIASLSVNQSTPEQYSEKGSILARKIRGESITQAILGASLGYVGNIQQGDNAIIKPTAKLNVGYDMKGDKAEATTSFINSTSTTKVTGNDPDRMKYGGSLGITYEQDVFSMSLNYDGNFTSSSQSNSLELISRVKF